MVAFGDFLVSRGRWPLNYALGLPRLKEPALLPKALDVDEARRIALVASALAPMGRALVLVLLYGGLRRSEARLLEWRHVESGAKWLRFVGKGNRERAVALHPEAAEAVMTWRSWTDEAHWCFPSPRIPGRPVSESYIRDLMHAVGEPADVPGLHAHLLRHTVATRLIELGADLRTVQEFLGHADPKNTSLYLKVRPARVAEAVQVLDFGGTTVA